MKKIILLGPPGSGKGTQAQALSAHFGWPVIPAGDLLRTEIKNKTPLGEEIAQLINNGHLVPDSLITTMVSHKIDALKTAPVIIIDGFPRTVGQAQSLNDTLGGVDAVINFDIQPEDLIERLSGRRIAPSSGRSYHILYNPPKVAGQDDLTGETLIQREDDQPEKIRTRMAAYHQATSPVLDFYQQQLGHSNLRLLSVNAALPIETIFKNICDFVAPLV